RGGPHAPYVQTERRAIYHEVAEELLRKGEAYPCFCTPDELKERREAAMKEGRTPGYDGRCRLLTADEIAARKSAGLPMALRIHTPPGESSWVDAIKGEIRFEHRNLEDFVIPPMCCGATITCRIHRARSSCTGPWARRSRSSATCR
ncbi:MAG: glutamyl-tRNA synthetase, partial [bacterium]